MSEQTSSETIRMLLHRKVMASHWHRALVAQRLDMSESELAALAYLAQGALTPGQLGQRLQLTSGGITALLRRLETGGHVSRRPHPRDRRSVMLVANAGILDRIAELYAPLAVETDALTAGFSARERATIARFLEGVVGLSERTVEELVADGAEDDQPPDEGRVAQVWA